MIRHSDRSASGLLTNEKLPPQPQPPHPAQTANAGSSNAPNAVTGSENVNNSLSDQSQSIPPFSQNVNNNPTTSSAYTLYLEHLGGFLPILKGKRVSKIRPEFIIYDPQLPGEK